VSWQTSKSSIALRGAARRLGINRTFARLLRPRSYEERFQHVMLGLIRPGDVVWDVGANVGMYACRFADIVGPAGKVFALEPSPANRQRLLTRVTGLPNVVVIPMALGETRALIHLLQGDDALGATTRVVSSVPEGGDAVVAQQESGDGLITDHGVDVPAVIKIDTEGSELDVLRGMGRVLGHSVLRAVCLEVHFGLLAARGTPDTPAVIERLLQSAGFALNWADASHLIATRA
jgi:FkbM family methyltransferase